MTKRTEGYRNGWRDAWLGRGAERALLRGESEYAIGYRLGYLDRVRGLALARRNFLRANGVR